MTASGLAAGDRVCVTGASGYIGSYVTEALLERGCRVRATVRDATDEQKTAHLRSLPHDDGQLEIVSATLEDSDALENAVDDCSFVAHVASSVRLTADDPQKEIVDVAVEGTRRVLEAVTRVGAARRVVLTSSAAAIIDAELPDSHLFSEADWNESATVEDNAYPLSKTLAERTAWELAENAPWSLVALCPVVVLGPVMTRAHGRSSPSFVRDLMRGKFPAVPRLNLGVVDIREVAEAHVRVLERPEITGRFLLHSESTPFMGIADVLRAAYPDRKLPRRHLPNLLMRVMALFDKRISKGLLDDLGRSRTLSNERSIEQLGLAYRPAAESIRDTAEALVTLGAV